MGLGILGFGAEGGMAGGHGFGMEEDGDIVMLSLLPDFISY